MIFSSSSFLTICETAERVMPSERAMSLEMTRLPASSARTMTFMNCSSVLLNGSMLWNTLISSSFRAIPKMSCKI